MATIPRNRQIHKRLLIGRPDGQTWVDVADYLSSIEIELGSIEQLGTGTGTDIGVRSASFELRNVPGKRFAPRDRTSPWNLLNGEWAPLLWPYREVVFQTAVTAPGVSPAPQDWITIFEGYMGDSIVTESHKVTVSLRDKSKLLQDTYIDVKKTYEGPISAEDLIQAIINDYITDAPPSLYCPVPSGITFEEMTVEYVSVWDAIQNVAKQIGWYLGYRWNGVQYVLAFIEPPRNKTTHDFELDWEDVILNESLDIGDSEIRNALTITFRDAATGEPVTLRYTDYPQLRNEASISEYRLRAMEITEKETSLIDSVDKALRFGELCIWDLSELSATNRITLPYIPEIDVFSTLRVTNPLVSSTSDFYAVQSVRHTLRFGDSPSFRTEVIATGRVVGARKRWLDMETRPGRPGHPSNQGPPGPPGEVQVPKPVNPVWSDYTLTNTLNLRWRRAEFASGYEIRTNLNWGELEGMIFRGYAHSFSFIPAERELILYLRALNAIGEYSEGYDTIHVSLPAPQAPQQPTVEAFFNALRISPTPLNSPSVMGYYVYVTGDGIDDKLAINAGGSLTYPLPSGTTVTIQVSAYDILGEGDKSEPLQATTTALTDRDIPDDIVGPSKLTEDLRRDIDLSKTKSAEAISLVGGFGDRITAAETVLEDASQRLESVETELEAIDGKLTTQETKITNIEGELSSKVSQTDFDTLSGIVASHGTTLTQHASAIEAKAEKSEVDILEGRVTAAEGQISAQAGQIALKANASDVYTKAQVDTELGKKADKTAVDDLTTRVTDVELTIDAHAGAIAQKAERSEVYTKTEIDGIVDGIEIGGRNLLQNTDGSRGTDFWSWTGSASLVEIAGGIIKKTNAIGESYPRLFQNSIQQKELELGSEYVLSFESRREPAGTQPVWIADSNGDNRTLNVDVNHTEDWSRHTILFVHEVPLSSNASLQFWINKHQSDDVATLYLRNIKLEKGNKATDWTPAPEDVEAEINTVKTDVATLITNYDSITARVESAEGDINTLTGEVNSVKSDVSQLEIKADGIQSTVTSLDAEINAVSTQVTQLADEITLKVQKRTSDGKYVVTGIGVAIGEDSQSEVAILADRFRILGDVEGESQPVFAVDTQTQKIYILGDLIAEGLIRATEVQADIAKALLLQADLAFVDDADVLRLRADKIMVGGSTRSALSVTKPEGGKLWHFDHSLHSTCGIKPLEGAVATLRPNEGRFGGAVAVEEGTTNLWTNPGWLDGSLTGWQTYSTLNATGSYEVVENARFGYSLRLTKMDSGSGRWGIRQGKTWHSAGSYIADSIYVKVLSASSGATLKLYSDYRGADGTNRNGRGFSLDLSTMNISQGSGGATHLSITPVGDGWHRIEYVTIDSDIVSGNSYYWIDDNAADILLAYSQKEAKPFATSFVDGTRAARSLYYSQLLDKKRGTLSVWINPHIVANWNNFFLMNLSTGRFLLYFGADGWSKWDFGPLNSGPGTPAGTIVAGQWAMHTLTWDADAGVFRYYLNGELVGSRTYVEPDSLPSALPTVTNYGALIDELLVLPYAATDAEIKTWYEMGAPFYDPNSVIAYQGEGGIVEIDNKGIRATRNSDGKETFKFDTETGNAFFRGDITGASGTFGKVTIGENGIIAMDANGDYSRLNGSTLAFFKAGSDIPSWYARRIAVGEASDGEHVTLNFDLEPKVIVSLKSIQSYVSSQSGEDQVISCEAVNITPEGFDVIANTRVPGAKDIVDVNRLLQAPQEWVGSASPPDVTSIKVDLILQADVAVRGYANVYYRKYGTTPWIQFSRFYHEGHWSGSTSTSHSAVIDGLPRGSYQVRVVAEKVTGSLWVRIINIEYGRDIIVYNGTVTWMAIEGGSD